MFDLDAIGKRLVERETVENNELAAYIVGKILKEQIDDLQRVGVTLDNGMIAYSTCAQEGQPSAFAIVCVGDKVLETYCEQIKAWFYATIKEHEDNGATAGESSAGETVPV